MEEGGQLVEVLTLTHLVTQRLVGAHLAVAGVLHPIRGAKKIAKWTDRKLLPTLVDFIKLGFTIPSELKEDHRKVEAAFERLGAPDYRFASPKLMVLLQGLRRP